MNENRVDLRVPAYAVYISVMVKRSKRQKNMGVERILMFSTRRDELFCAVGR